MNWFQILYPLRTFPNRHLSNIGTAVLWVVFFLVLFWIFYAPSYLYITMYSGSAQWFNLYCWTEATPQQFFKLFFAGTRQRLF